MIIYIIIIILILLYFNSYKNNEKINCYSSLIPKKIFQTHKSLEYIQTKPKIVNAINSWKKWTPEFEYIFHNDYQADNFIKNNFDKKIYNAYCSLPLAVMKADLWRYCVIYHYGGIYADTDTICLINPNCLLKDSLLVCVPENNNKKLCQWVFSAPKKSPIIKKIIEVCVEKIINATNFDVENILNITGPGVFTLGIDNYLLENDYKIFQNKEYYSDYYKNNILYVFYAYDFHYNMVKHIFSGFDNDGWKIESSIKTNNYYQYYKTQLLYYYNIL